MYKPFVKRQRIERDDEISAGIMQQMCLHVEIKKAQMIPMIRQEFDRRNRERHHVTVPIMSVD